MSQTFWPVEQTSAIALASGALSKTTSTAGKAWFLTSVEIQLSGDVSQSYVISRDSGNGAAYDTILKSGSLSSEKTLLYQPTQPILINKNDEVKVTLTNSATPAITGGLTILGYEAKL